MNKTLLTGCILTIASALFAQTTSNLSTVDNLLLSTKSINVTTSGTDVFEKTDITPTGDYTLEVKSTVTSSANRGLDAEVRDAAGQGFRVSCSPTAIMDFANIFSAGSSIVTNDNTSLTTMRYVMYNNTLNIYKNDAVTPINAAPIAKTSVSRNLIDDAGFENGGWTNWIASGSVGSATLKEPADIVQYDATLATPTVVPNSGKAMFFDIQSGTNGNGWYYSVPVTAGLYEYKVKSLPYKVSSSTTAINNTLVRIRAGVGLAGTSLGSVYLNGHSGNGAWVNTTIRFEVPVGETNVSLTIEKSNNNKIYFDDFELRRIGNSFTTLSADNNATNNTGIYDNLNLLKTTTSFEDAVVDASPGGLWESNKAMGGSTSARIQTPAITTNLKDGNNAFMMRFEQSYTWFSYPVTLQPNKVYKLSYLQAGNSASMASYYVAVCNAKDGATASTYYLKSATTPNATALVGSIVTQYFVTPATLPSEPVYLSFYKNGTNAPVFHVDKLVLLEADGVELKGLLVGKNFYNGAANMEITSIKYTTGAYIPYDLGSKLEENNFGQFIGYANGQLTLRNINACELSVFDVTGKKMLSNSLQSANTSLSVQLPKGVYVVKAGEMSQKLIVR